MEFFAELASSMLDNMERHLLGFLVPKDRLFALWLLSSGLIAWFVYRSVKGTRHAEDSTFLRFLFPGRVWSHPSAWLDLRYFVFNSIFGKFLLIGITAASTAFGYKLFAGGVAFTSVVGQGGLSFLAELAISVSFMFFAMIVSDFLAWFCHWLQHKSPLLWQFHKVHHSAEVMHPVSNYREHPVDNLLYMSVIGAGYGIMMALVVRTLGYLPGMPMLLGMPVLMLLFNLAGYNLRHSHVWLRWPGKLSMIFPSPAHHHVHHSSHPDHLDKNFAFMFPVWDVVFRTYHMPEDNRDVKFGIGEGNAEDLTSCLRLYWVPFRDAWRVIRAQAKGEPFSMSKPAAPEKLPHAPAVHPAE
ncbi:sterol desaturase family protein [Roseobacter sp.]|uniref:sterol desaturase family protein n=1 Tax=Roseobacter sp. TaxID=1907202 RepID=UPI0025D375CA|nr:sterol desaturase family protein [Roseobacter sp.]